MLVWAVQLGDPYAEFHHLQRSFMITQVSQTLSERTVQRPDAELGLVPRISVFTTEKKGAYCLLTAESRPPLRKGVFF